MGFSPAGGKTLHEKGAPSATKRSVPRGFVCVDGGAPRKGEAPLSRRLQD